MSYHPIVRALINPLVALLPVLWFEAGETCDSQVSAMNMLTCSNACGQGCARAMVTTNQGNTGTMCTCDVIGPPAVCCKIAQEVGVTPPHYEDVGTCSLESCNPGECTVIICLQPPEWTFCGITASCEE